MKDFISFALIIITLTFILTSCGSDIVNPSEVDTKIEFEELNKKNKDLDVKEYQDTLFQGYICYLIPRGLPYHWDEEFDAEPPQDFEYERREPNCHEQDTQEKCLEASSRCMWRSPNEEMVYPPVTPGMTSETEYE